MHADKNELIGGNWSAVRKLTYAVTPDRPTRVTEHSNSANWRSGEFCVLKLRDALLRPVMFTGFVGPIEAVLLFGRTTR